MGKDSPELGEAILGIKVGIIAMMISLCVEVLSDSVIIPTLFKDVFYLTMAGILFFLVLKMETPKKS